MRNARYLTELINLVNAFETILKMDAAFYNTSRDIQTPLVDQEQLNTLITQVKNLRNLAMCLDHTVRGMNGQTIAKMYKLTPGRVSHLLRLQQQTDQPDK